MPPLDVDIGTLLGVIFGGLFTVAGGWIQSRAALRLLDRRTSDRAIEKARAILLDAVKLFRSSPRSDHSHSLRTAVEDALPEIVADLRMEVGYMRNRRLRRDMDLVIEVLWDLDGIAKWEGKHPDETFLTITRWGDDLLSAHHRHDRPPREPPVLKVYRRGLGGAAWEREEVAQQEEEYRKEQSAQRRREREKKRAADSASSNEPAAGE